jgi:hypothetical protein
MQAGCLLAQSIGESGGGADAASAKLIRRSTLSPRRPGAHLPPDRVSCFAEPCRVGDPDRVAASTRRTSTTSRVVPEMPLTIAASRWASAFSRLDLPALGG